MQLIVLVAFDPLPNATLGMGLGSRLSAILEVWCSNSLRFFKKYWGKTMNKRKLQCYVVFS